MLRDGPVLPFVTSLLSRPDRPKMILDLEVPHKVPLLAFLETGVNGIYAQSNLGTGVLLKALQELAAGRRFIDPTLRALLEHGLPVSDELSPREIEILALVADGLTNKQIATELFISPVTARDHVQRIIQKLAVPDRTAAAVEGLRRRYITT